MEKLTCLWTGLTGKYDPKIGCFAILDGTPWVPVSKSSRSSSIGGLPPGAPPERGSILGWTVFAIVFLIEIFYVSTKILNIAKRI